MPKTFNIFNVASTIRVIPDANSRKPPSTGSRVNPDLAARVSQLPNPSALPSWLNHIGYSDSTNPAPFSTPVGNRSLDIFGPKILATRGNYPIENFSQFLNVGSRLAALAAHPSQRQPNFSPNSAAMIMAGLQLLQQSGLQLPNGRSRVSPQQPSLRPSSEYGLPTYSMPTYRGLPAPQFDPGYFNGFSEMYESLQEAISRGLFSTPRPFSQNAEGDTAAEKRFAEVVNLVTSPPNSRVYSMHPDVLRQPSNDADSDHNAQLVSRGADPNAIVDFMLTFNGSSLIISMPNHIVDQIRPLISGSQDRELLLNPVVQEIPMGLFTTPNAQRNDQSHQLVSTNSRNFISTETINRFLESLANQNRFVTPGEPDSNSLAIMALPPSSSAVRYKAQSSESPSNPVHHFGKTSQNPYMASPQLLEILRNIHFSPISLTIPSAQDSALLQRMINELPMSENLVDASVNNTAHATENSYDRHDKSAEVLEPLATNDIPGTGVSDADTPRTEELADLFTDDHSDANPDANPNEFNVDLAAPPPVGPSVIQLNNQEASFLKHKLRCILGRISNGRPIENDCNRAVEIHIKLEQASKLGQFPAQERYRESLDSLYLRESEDKQAEFFQEKLFADVTGNANSPLTYCYLMAEGNNPVKDLFNEKFKSFIDQIIKNLNSPDETLKNNAVASISRAYYQIKFKGAVGPRSYLTAVVLSKIRKALPDLSFDDGKGNFVKISDNPLECFSQLRIPVFPDVPTDRVDTAPSVTPSTSAKPMTPPAVKATTASKVQPPINSSVGPTTSRSNVQSLKKPPVSPTPLRKRQPPAEPVNSPKRQAQNKRSSSNEFPPRPNLNRWRARLQNQKKLHDNNRLWHKSYRDRLAEISNSGSSSPPAKLSSSSGKPNLQKSIISEVFEKFYGSLLCIHKSENIFSAKLEDKSKPCNGIIRLTNDRDLAFEKFDSDSGNSDKNPNLIVALLYMEKRIEAVNTSGSGEKVEFKLDAESLQELNSGRYNQELSRICALTNWSLVDSSQSLAENSSAPSPSPKF